ncbi:MAG: DNA-directed RNA polymerase subunit alpha C-terminal domain-containing protein [Blastococcus sp.]
MPHRSPHVHAGTIRDLGLPGRAVTALTRAGVTSVDDLAVLSARDLAAISGLGPGTIAAIRIVVPEPATSARRFPPRPVTDDEGWPAAPAIPSFDSLRAPRRRTPVDVLMPSARTEPADASAPARGPRPPDYADLLRLGAVVVSAVAGLAGRVALWSVREPAHCLRRLLPG